jgi:hypothetical protein
MNQGVSCPFPFSDQPGVPQREKYIAPNVLKTLSSRKTKPVNTTGSLPPLGNKEGVGKSVNNGPLISPPMASKPSRKGSIWGGQANVNGFDRTDIGMLVDHLITTSGSGSDVVTMIAFDAVLKKFAAHNRAASAEEHARRALCTFELFLQFRNKSLFTWFKSIDTVGTGAISHFKFQHSLKELAFEVKQPLVWSEAELQDLTDFVCHNSNSDISLYSIENAFERMHHHNERLGDEAVISSLLLFLRGIMKRERIRVVDLFHHMGEDGNGTVSRDAMIAGLKALILHPHDLKPKHHSESVAGLYYQEGGGKKLGEKLRPVVHRPAMKGAGGSMRSLSSTTGASPATSPKKSTRCSKKNEEEEFVRLMRESQQYLDSKVDAFNKKDANYQTQVKQGVKKYINTSVMGYDRHIDTDLNRLLKL